MNHHVGFFQPRMKKTAHGMKQENFIDRVGHVSPNGYRVTALGGPKFPGTAWRFCCDACGNVPKKRKSDEPRECTWGEIRAMKPCACRIQERKA